MLRIEEEEETLPLAPVRWEEGCCYLLDSPFTPIIFDGAIDQIGTEFNSILIAIDGQWQTELKWDEARQQAKQAVEKGLKLLWQIDLGLFDRLPLPLEHQSQLMGLELSLKHFSQTLWKEFENETLGVVLFRGSADYAQELKWSPDQTLAYQEWLGEGESDSQKTLFAADVVSHYLLTLIRRLPDALPLFLMLDASSIHSLTLQARLFSVERYDRILLAIKGCRIPSPHLVWEEGCASYGFVGSSSLSLSLQLDARVGIALPSIHFKSLAAYAGLEELLASLKRHQIPYKIIAEERLALEWVELETLCFLSQGLTEAGKRQLRGFAAAGGELVAIQDRAGLPSAINWDDWIKSYLETKEQSA